VRGSFEATHRLHGDFGLATLPHGHAYQVEAAVRGPEIGADGTLVDVGVLQRLLEGALMPLHTQDLDALGVFRGENTTAEVVARYLFAGLQTALLRDPGPGIARVASLRVTVWESPVMFATYEGLLHEPGRA